MALADAPSLWEAPEKTAVAAEPATALDLRALFMQHHGRICRLLRRFGVQPSQIDDAAQEVFWVAARRLSEIQAGREASFLYGVALRVASSDLRRQKADAPAVEPIDLSQIACPLPSAEEQLDGKRARALLDVALDRLPHELRTVLVLFELEGVELREIAALSGLPLGTVNSRLRRAREEFSAIARRIRSALLRGGSLP
jgi:RNA polymerase sigma-70 factor (ECF subfamily)